MLATSSFEFGRQVSGYLYVWKHPSDDATEESEQVTSTEDTRICGCCRHSAVLSSNGIVKQPILQPKLFIVFFALMVLALFVIGNIVYEIQFYRNMILLWLFAPLGALMRWKLSKWNSINNRRIFTRRLQWLPLGTLCANLLGSIFSIVCMGLLDRLQNKEEYVFDSWSIAVLFAVQTGFAGSLSTVSSFVKEVAFLSDDHPNNVKSHLYAVITCTSAIVLGLIIYMPMARI
jgi:fluoride ion exporter CrcB/FEX